MDMLWSTSVVWNADTQTTAQVCRSAADMRVSTIRSAHWIRKSSQVRFQQAAYAYSTRSTCYV